MKPIGAPVFLSLLLLSIQISFSQENGKLQIHLMNVGLELLQQYGRMVGGRGHEQRMLPQRRLDQVPFVHTFRTFCLAPTPQIKAVFEDLALLELRY